MALKPDREILQTNVRFRIESGKDAERGTILVADSTDGVAAKPSTTALSDLGTERPLGLLLDDVENIDASVRPQIWSRNVVSRGSEVSLLTKGRVLTNLIKAGVTVAQGETAYLAASGYVSNAEHVTGSGIIVGYFESAKDADGYAHLYVDINGRRRV